MTKRTLEENLAFARAKAAKAEKLTPAAQQLKLEMWPDAVRGIPNAVLRGALFSVGKVRKIFSKRTVIAALEGYEIRYLGTTLNQTDLDVWEMLLHLARLQPLGAKVEFTAHALLKELGRGTSGMHHEQLKETIARLAAGLAEITWIKDKKTFAGTLITSFFRDEETGRYVVKFNPDMAKLYGSGHTRIDWQQRQSLGQNNLAKWLHGFYSSHAKPFPYKVETLRGLCGSAEELRGFRRRLKAALVDLVSIGSLKSWEIDPGTDLVAVVNMPTKTQLKYLQKTPKR
jgi:hypothetical protein